MHNDERKSFGWDFNNINGTNTSVPDAHCNRKCFFSDAPGQNIVYPN